MLVAFIYLYHQTGSFEIVDYYKFQMPMNVQVLIFLAFFAAFAVKIPMWPVHTWLPDATWKPLLVVLWCWLPSH